MFFIPGSILSLSVDISIVPGGTFFMPRDTLI